MTILSVSGYKNVSGVLKGTRKAKIYRVPHTFTVELQDIDRSELSLCGLQTHSSARYSYGYERNPNNGFVEPYYTYNNKVYTPYPTHGEHNMDENVSELLAACLKKNHRKYDMPDISSFKVSNVATPENLENNSFEALDFFLSSDHALDIIDESDLVKVMGDDETFRNNIFSKLAGDYIVVDNEVYQPTRGPEFIENQNRIGYSICANKTPYIPKELWDKDIFNDRNSILKLTDFHGTWKPRLPLNLYNRFVMYRNCKVRTYSQTGSTYILDIKPFYAMNKDMYGFILFNSIFGVGLQNILDTMKEYADNKHQRHFFPTITTDEYLDMLVSVYEWGDDFRKKIDDVHDSCYDHEKTCDLIDFFLEKIPTLEMERNYINKENGGKPYGFASDYQIGQLILREYENYIHTLKRDVVKCTGFKDMNVISNEQTLYRNLKPLLMEYQMKEELKREYGNSLEMGM